MFIKYWNSSYIGEIVIIFNIIVESYTKISDILIDQEGLIIKYRCYIRMHSDNIPAYEECWGDTVYKHIIF